MKQVLVGAVDWRVERWRSEYYPEDLPSDWQLAYYANDFSTVLLDCRNYLDDKSLDELGEVLEDCHEDFQPVLSVYVDQVEPCDVERFLQWLQELDPEMGIGRLRGVCLSGLGKFPAELLSGWRACIPAELSVALDIAGSIDAPDVELQSQQDITFTWKTGCENHKHAWLAKVSLQQQPRELAQQLTRFLQQAPESQPACVIVSEGYENIVQMHDLTTLIRLING